MKNNILKNRTLKSAGALLALALLCTFGAACGKGNTVPVATPSFLPEKTSTPTLQPTDTAAPTPTEKPTDTPTPTPTERPTDTPTPTPTKKPTNTPAPTSAETEKLLSQHAEKVESATYTKMYDTFSKDTYGFPVISITTLDGAPVYKALSTVSCVVDTFNCDSEAMLSATARIRVRGNSSAATSQGGLNDSARSKYPDESYPYKIKFDTKQNLFGLNSGYAFKDWVLLENNANPYTHLYGFRLASALHSGKYYVSDGCLVHVYLNGRYMGMYTLCEQSEAKKHRVNVKEPEEGYTGTDIGYFLELDNYPNAADNPFIKLNHERATVTDVQGMKGTFKTREYTIHSDITCDEQLKFIESYMSNVFKIVYEAVEHKKYLMLDENLKTCDAAGVYDNAKDCIGAVMDLESVVYSYLVEEITMDYDRGEGSFYMAVDFSEKSKYQKLTFLCPWDFEWGYFGASRFPSGHYELLAGALDNMFPGYNFGDRANYWFVLLMKEDWFREMVREKWSEFYAGGAYEKMVAELREYGSGVEKDLKLATTHTWTGSCMGLVDQNRARIEWLDREWFGAGITR